MNCNNRERQCEGGSYFSSFSIRHFSRKKCNRIPSCFQDLSKTSVKYGSSNSGENGDRAMKFRKFYSLSPKHVVDPATKKHLQVPKLTVTYQPHHYSLSNGINYNNKSNAKSPTDCRPASNGFSWKIENGDISNSLPSISLHISEATPPISELFVYQCEFCSESFSCDQLLIDHCARKHTKDVKCQHCEKSFYWEKDLHFHMRKHIKKGRGYKCQICTGLFIESKELKEHMKMHDSEDAITDGSFPCDICDRKFKSNRTLQEHKKRFSHKQCEVCLEYFSSDATLFNHFNVHVVQTAPSYRCDQCDDIFSTKRLLKMHRKKHHLYECEMCSAEFQRKADIKSHLRMECTKRTLFHCSICKKSFLSEDNCNAHLRIRHFERNKCEFCSEKFLKRSELLDHLNKHSDIEHPYQCQICLSTMTSRFIFNLHLKSHNNRTDFKCDKCGRCFQQLRILQYHMKSHLMDTFKCTICTMSFSDAQRLQQHSHSHNVNEFQCDICKRSFRSRNLIFAHMTDVHQTRKKCHICDKDFINQKRLITHLKSHYVRVEFPDDDDNGM